MKKLIKVISLIFGVVVIGAVMAGCRVEEGGNKPNLTIEQSSGGSGGVEAKEQRIENKYARSTDGVYTGRTRIVDGQIVEWAEEYPEDKNNKPIRYEVVEGLSSPCHRIFYNVNGQEIKVNVNEETGDRRFYEEGKTYTFAQIGKGVPDSNESVLKQVAANRKLNEVIEEKYRK